MMPCARAIGAGDRKQCDQQIDGTHGAGSGSLRLGGARWHVAGTFLEGEGRMQHRFTRPYRRFVVLR